MRPLLKVPLYTLGIYTTYVATAHFYTRHIISNRTPEEKFHSLKLWGRFENPFVEYRPQTIYEFLVVRVLELFGLSGKFTLPTSMEQRKLDLNWQAVDNAKLIQNLNKDDQISYTWIGQSCAIVNCKGLRILTDPVFGDHLISKKFGPERILPIPVTINEELIENIDVVVVSHDHPDHLEFESIQLLLDKKWVVPLGMKRILLKWGIQDRQIVELDWWQSIQINKDSQENWQLDKVISYKNKESQHDKLNAIQAQDGCFELVCLPAMHWSGRSLASTNASLWCTFLVRDSNNSNLFFHGGDTGYTDGLFRQISKSFAGPLQLAALPIGQYCPEWHQAPRHISPSEALKIANELKAKNVVGVHWGTWVLSAENYTEPARTFRKLQRSKEAQNTNVKVIGPGETLELEFKS
ncbi:N-acetylphosphatidylethanolamine-hydrolyzing phospholipase D [Martiniozyma asiatica (nom. inval.)]|nr:N-acetylphosphatidylethanolamine-hydrolyzing phospholipase D [Martiniozyma asiatica]